MDRTGTLTTRDIAAFDEAAAEIVQLFDNLSLDEGLPIDHEIVLCLAGYLAPDDPVFIQEIFAQEHSKSDHQNLCEMLVAYFCLGSLTPTKEAPLATLLEAFSIKLEVSPRQYHPHLFSKTFLGDYTAFHFAHMLYATRLNCADKLFEKLHFVTQENGSDKHVLYATSFKLCLERWLSSIGHPCQAMVDGIISEETFTCQQSNKALRLSLFVATVGNYVNGCVPDSTVIKLIFHSHIPAYLYLSVRKYAALYQIDGGGHQQGV
ncbi:hypothetical protein BKA70DRAFT_1424534 [Coprinopsis sp. MPI-PUGE-AT-0042]|nr:hypothetical protein BKA70DRAFT_1424534 [Coprinopsis sp. MPI-PUGE-AT-0042]